MEKGMKMVGGKLRGLSTGRKRAALAATGAAAVATVVGLAVPAGASPLAARPAAVTGAQHFQMMNTTTSETTTTNPLLAWGLVTAAGVDKESANNNIDTFKFAGGTFLVKHATKKGTQHQSFNPKTCLFQYSEKGTFKVGSGTGKYKGISGGGTYALSVVGIGAKLKNGKCNPSQTAPAAGQQQEIQAVGTVKLP
jgi:hypothetical protein